MPRGGRHENTLKPKWDSGQTCTVRIPIAKKKEILAFAKTLDKVNGEWSLVETDKYQTVVNLLEESLDFPLNNGSRYRNQIIKVLRLLGEEVPDQERRGRRSTKKMTTSPSSD